MEEDVIDDNIWGRWTVFEDSIKVFFSKNQEVFIGASAIYKFDMMDGERVWDLPIHFANKIGFSEVDIEDLLEAMRRFRAIQSASNNLNSISEVDKRTKLIASQIINSRH